MDGQRPLDAVRNYVDRMPEELQPFLRLSRYDRPVGFWLLAIPCWAGLALARMGDGFQTVDIAMVLLYGIGAIAMRGAGCTYNDILDRKIDAEVERTAGRPLPSGQVTLRDAWLWLFFQVGVGFIVWLALPMPAKVVALLSIPLVAAYPLMKRVTWWPQAWLGLTFNFGVLIAAVAAGGFGLAALLLYASLICWTVGYDTVYALQDREDDALIGVKSTARLFGEKALFGIAAFYGASVILFCLAGWLRGGGLIVSIAALMIVGHFLWQLVRLARNEETEALAVFKSNRSAGLILVAGLGVAVLFGGLV